ncbi:hypothetical protein SAMN05216496_3818 [Pseudomonas sp. Z003-0.4C(8344-21)]|nr:hypothetical protein SAMN05216496_3818 [Pseudomonas sp. Z003-0.4C(8344-21)]
MTGWVAGIRLSFTAGRPMNHSGNRVLPLAFLFVLLAGCASPPPPAPVAPPPPPERTCQVMENTEVAGDMYVDGQVTRHITTTRCITQ